MDPYAGWRNHHASLMQKPFMKEGGIFDHNGNSLAASASFTPSAQEVKGIKDAILTGDMSFTTSGVTLNKESFAVLKLERSDRMCLLKSKSKQDTEPLSGCVMVCPTVVVIGVSADGGIRGAGAGEVIRVANYISDNT
ncbi:uncharacterized protein LOC124150313 [Haliotis rufescens]|uniref:uncharacterized protein LOC124150313 n=1 Tax=Haliotis rufescens TaxID=6454 RepID=UPI001EB06133|nr:uncharacterized protein LOC124150313 [Haliotis rufescens]